MTDHIQHSMMNNNIIIIHIFDIRKTPYGGYGHSFRGTCDSLRVTVGWLALKDKF